MLLSLLLLFAVVGVVEFNVSGGGRVVFVVMCIFIGAVAVSFDVIHGVIVVVALAAFDVHK